MRFAVASQEQQVVAVGALVFEAITVLAQYLLAQAERVEPDEHIAWVGVAGSVFCGLGKPQLQDARLSHGGRAMSGTDSFKNLYKKLDATSKTRFHASRRLRLHAKLSTYTVVILSGCSAQRAATSTLMTPAT